MCLLQDVKDMNCVEEVDVIVVIPWYIPAHVLFNMFIRFWRLIGGLLGKLPPRPLAQSQTPAFRCSAEMEEEREQVVLLNVFKITDNKVFAEYPKGLLFVLNKMSF